MTEFIVYIKIWRLGFSFHETNMIKKKGFCNRKLLVENII